MSRDTAFQIGPYEQFELWLGSLALHHKQKRRPYLKAEEVKNPNYREDLRISLQILKNLTALPPQAIEMQLEEGSYLRSRPIGGVARLLAHPVGRAPDFAEDLAAFTHFRNTLDHYRTLCLSLIRVRYVSAQQFDAFTALLSEQIRNYRLLKERRRLARTLVVEPMAYTLQRYVLVEVENGGVRDQISLVLGRFVRAITALAYVRDELQSSFQPRPTAALLNCLYFRLNKLISLLDDSQTYFRHISEAWSEAAEMTAAALKLEVRNAFKTGFRQLRRSTEPRLQYIQLEELAGVVQNTCQESFVNLCCTLNPSFDEFELFHNLYRRYEESVRLLDSLNSLHRLVAEPPIVNPHEKWEDILREVEEFRVGPGRSLFARDRLSMEEFSEKLEKTPKGDRDQNLHQFEIYLSTLVGEVRKRSIFSKFERHSLESPDGAPTGDSDGRQIINW